MSVAPVRFKDTEVVIDRMAWIPKASLSDQDMFLLRRELVKTPIKMAEFAGMDEDEKPVVLYEEHGRWFGVPRAYYESVMRSKCSGLTEKPMFCETRSIPDSRMELKGIKLGGTYSEQAEMVRQLSEFFKGGGMGGIFRADPGYGKTVVALRVISELKVPTLVVVHKDFLLTQWINRIRKYLPNARIGNIQQDKVVVEGCDIVIAMLQSLSQREYDRSIYSAFGLVVIDETHRLGASSWAPVIRKFRGRWRLGLTATARRKDGMEDVFFWNIGPIIVSAKVKTKLPKLKRIRTASKLPRAGTLEGNARVSKTDKEQAKSVMTPTVLRHIARDTQRNKVIVEQIFEAATSENLRKVIVLSERKDSHLHLLKDDFEKFCVKKKASVTTGFYYGGLSERELLESEGKRVLFCTYQMVSEALDIESLDTLVLATPISDVEQAVGRIRRQCTPDSDKCARLCPWRAGVCKGKPDPIVVDILDPLIDRCEAKARWRMMFYREEGIMGKQA
jgi:superfamily II DNA or RNA helicase